MLQNQVKMLMEENPFTEKWYWREASMFNTLKCFIEVWSEKYEECKTVTEKKNFSLFIMEQLKKYNEILQKIEVKL